MAILTTDAIEKAIRKRWHWSMSDKARRYINTFFDPTRMGDTIFAKVKGNHGVYKVSISFDADEVYSTCSCYIGKSGYCHHCEALAHTFLHNNSFFVVLPTYHIADLKNATTPQQLATYLQGILLQTIIEELHQRGLKPKDIATSMGVSSQRISALLKREKQFGAFSELAAMKLACLWLLDHLEQTQTSQSEIPKQTAG